MSTIKLTPRNLPGIQKHFKTKRIETEKKLRDINRRRIGLEKELEIYKDGEDWCEDIYTTSKKKG